MLWPWKLILDVQVGPHQQMTPIDFDVSRSKVKVVVTLD